MSEPSVRRFDITANQYEVFRFSIPQRSTLRFRLTATAPVNLILLDSEDYSTYASGATATYPYEASWGRKSDLEASVRVRPGTWYLVVEGSTEPSRGKIEVLQ